MGALVFEKCYPSTAAAADAYFSAKAPAFSAGVTSYQSWFEKADGIWQLKRQAVSEAGTVTNLATVVATVPSFSACDETEPFLDGVAVGWLIVSLLLVSWAVAQLRRVMR